MTFHKYTKIKILGDEENEGIFSNPEDDIVIQEKMDGANFRAMIQDGNIIFGSRSQQITSNEGEDTNVQKNFLRCINFVREKLKDKDLEKYKGYIFYAECMVKHTMDYDWEKIPAFLGFDIYDLKANKFISYDGVEKIYNELELPIVPLIRICKAKEIKEVSETDVPTSKYSLHQAEGIIFKNYNKQIFGKYVLEKFREKNKEVFGGGKKYAKTDEDYLLAVYCTNARIDKWIFKLMDEGNALDMTLMHKLPNAVYKDIWEENWQEIYNLRNKTICFDKFKKAVSKRCLLVLKQVIVNNALNPINTESKGGKEKNE